MQQEPKPELKPKIKQEFQQEVNTNLDPRLDLDPKIGNKARFNLFISLNKLVELVDNPSKASEEN